MHTLTHAQVLSPPSSLSTSLVLHLPLPLLLVPLSILRLAQPHLPRLASITTHMLTPIFFSKPTLLSPSTHAYEGGDDESHTGLVSTLRAHRMLTPTM